MQQSELVPVDVIWQSTERRGVVFIEVTQGSERLAAEDMKVVNRKARDAFVKRLCKEHPGIDAQQRADLESKLLAIAVACAAHSLPKTTEGGEEVEASRIVRPELFHAVELSGVAIPGVRIVNGKPVGYWSLYVRWHTEEGKRECRSIETLLKFPGGGTLWFHPAPGDPSLNTPVGWSAQGRRAWLQGAPAPDACKVFQRVCESLTNFIEFSPEAAAGTVAAVALWSMFTYCFPAWMAVPYLAVGGPKGSGKTLVERVLGRLVFRPMESSNMTAPCLFRSLHDCGGVLLLDEAERLRDSTPDAGELRSILLSGYKRGSPARRLEKNSDGGYRSVSFDVFGPKVIACINALPETIASRTIRIVMFRAGPDSPKPRRRLDEDPDLWSRLRDDLHALALEHGPTWLALAGRSDVVPASLGGRDYELWQPLLALAAWLDERGANGLWRLVSEFAERSAELGRDDSISDADELLLHLLAGHVTKGTNRTLKASDLLLEAQGEDPATFGTEKNPRLSPAGVSAVLRRYHVQTRKGTGSVGKVYRDVTIGHLRRIERNYGFDLGLSPEEVPQGTAQYLEVAPLSP